MVYVIVGMAGVLGAWLRYAIGSFVHEGWSLSFPLGTLLINWLGCLLLGWFLTRVNQFLPAPPWLRAGFGSGFIGSFTTFSTFSYETVNLLHKGFWALAVSYVLLSLWGGLLMAWGGRWIATRLYRDTQNAGES
jgi:CrcB protein